MQDHQPTWRQPADGAAPPLAWPDYPDMVSTLLTAVGVAGIFLGLGSLLEQGWVIWLGFVVAAGVLASHVVRYRRATARRTVTRTAMRARLISQCRSLGGSNFLKSYHDESERVVLVLTDDALHIGHRNPLHIFATLPLYDISEVQVDGATGAATREPQRAGTLTLAVQGSGEKHYQLAFSDFERHAPATVWASALQPSVSQGHSAAD